MQKNDEHPVFRRLKRAARILCPAHTVTGAGFVQKGQPAVFVCNHVGAYAPIVTELFFPFPFRPWATHQVLTKRLCRQYLDRHFVRTELGWKRPFGGWLAAAIEPFCIRILRSAEAIPVYRGSRAIRRTFELSTEALARGSNLMIYLESSEWGRTGFPTGFLHLAELYRRVSGKKLPFYPVFADKKRRVLSIGRPAEFDSRRAFRQERCKVAGYLRRFLSGAEN